MKKLALILIAFYQRHLSPHKGFCCAYRQHTGHASCSELGRRSIRRHGLLKGLRILRRRLVLCGVAHRRYSPSVPRPPAAQRGDCDLNCCDVPTDGACGHCHGFDSCHGFDGNCRPHVLDGCDACSCEWPRKKHPPHGADTEASVHIPPHRSPA